MSELPKGWARAQLADVAEVIAGQSPSGADVNSFGVGIPFFQGKAEFGDLYPTARKWTPNPSRVARAGDILVSVRAPVGPTNLAPSECAIGRGLMAVRPSAELADRYVLWAMRASQDRLRDFATGSTFEAVTGPVVRRHSIPLAPRAEQERIVTAIEEALSKLDAGEAGLRTVRQLLERLREAVLAAAVSGRLVPQHPADIPATNSLADLGVEPDGLSDDLPPGWVPTTLGDLLQGIEAGKSFATQGQPARSGEMGVIKVSAMTWGEFRPEENKALPPGTPIEQRWVVRAGDLLLSRANTEEYVGACVLVPTDHLDLILSDKSLRLVPADGIEPRWLLHALRSRPARAQIEQLATGTKESMRNISQAKLRALRLSLPPTAEQGRIADELERQLSFIEACGRAIEIAGERGEALRRSVLKAAFEGRLVPQDPSEESASDLLRRLRDSDLADPASLGRRPMSETALAPS